ncbi:hypothetical protein KGR20_06270 [Cytobacillus oceanisediminis]|uniref:Uncharacterized protein n=2 Tax=Niallia TaxID=2837506 RepID=A0A941JNZ4_NIACI|nr:MULTISPECIES: hypothetical protein [Bacillaceae]EOR23599.1 hypothetical protein A499_11946 [Niallia nealsonii AAU1]MBQ6447341.1 hypothetical protein [Bacillus sp. (in: firmicutes)]MDU1844355.1 hypothetical protein [Niallia nealsonii]MBZ9533863.1 hypothetical protein [Cytobacillus oceanisediminis]MCB5238740.1 hypothetical protein [Niallia circulans]
MNVEKYILASITTNPNKVAPGSGVFYCEDTKELETIATNLEAILDGIAHKISEEVFIIVKH